MEGRPYEFKSFHEVNSLVDHFAKGKIVILIYDTGLHALNLCPELYGEGRIWHFLGIFARSREEWAVAALACMR